MQNRTIEIKCRLNQKEADALNRRVRRSGLSRENYLRQIINGLIPTNAPPPDYFSMMTQLRRIGVTLNQIAKKSEVDTQRYDDNVTLLKSAILEITNAVMLPRKMERKIE